jgi:ankyrin repeat protein
MSQTNHTLEHCIDCLREGRHDAFTSMLEENPSLAATPIPNSNETYLLHIAANIGDVRAGLIIINALQTLGQPLDDIKDFDDNRAQHWSAQCGHTEFLRLLRDNGADVLTPNMLGTMPLHDATRYGHLDAIRYMMEGRGLEILDKKNEYGLNALSIAANNLRYEVLEHFYQNYDLSSLTNQPNSRGYTPLDILEKRWLRLTQGKHSNALPQTAHDDVPVTDTLSTRQKYEATKALLLANRAEHSTLWKSQSDKERLGYIGNESGTYKAYQRRHKHVRGGNGIS